MVKYSTFSPGVQVNGEGVLAFIEGLGAFKRMGIAMLAEHGIVDPKPDQWYPLQAWLDAFSEMREKVGTNTIRLIGKQIPENARFPPQLDSIEKALASLDQAYHLNHKGGDIGEYLFESTGPRSCRVKCRNPYPCDFDRGVIETLSARFKPVDSAHVDVKHESHECRESGADYCTYSISW